MRREPEPEMCHWHGCENPYVAGAGDYNEGHWECGRDDCSVGAPVVVKDTWHDERIGFRVVEWVTDMGTLTVYTRDEPGAKGHKAETTKMEYAEPLPRAMKLKAKYLNR